ncbi:hypothetical protein [Methanoregula sp.]|uniref:hypothetical protein n=1 Tax=Methanoregula sp. TaxID=2052170 RepID=UPI000CB284DE|nr:hypothetical protein [Methanoregula sp.]PKG32411.1 MAG: hypothetical protein CW742_08335 [Methanoregula sp.]
MAATVEKVRRRPLNDITEPYLFSDEDIQEALDEAGATLELRGIDVDTVLGAKAQRLMAGKDVITDFINRIQSRAVTSISGGSDSVSLVDLIASKGEIEKDLNTLLEQLGSCPVEVS